MRRIAPLRRAAVRFVCPASSLTPSPPISARLFSATSPCHNEQGLPSSLKGPHDDLHLATADEQGAEGLLFKPTQTIETKTYRLPPRASEAEDAENIFDPAYVPATVATDLETIGGLDGWWQNASNYKETFSSFKPRHKIIPPVALRRVIRRALVEALALRSAGAESLLGATWPIGTQDSMHRVLAVNIGPDGTLTGDVAAVVADLRTPEENTPAPPNTAFILNACGSRKSPVDAPDAPWHSAPLNDMAIRFAISKRIFQLTGRRISDFQLSSMESARSIVEAFERSRQQTTLHGQLRSGTSDLFKIPNVNFASKRVTRGDKDVALGRFKVIAEELAKRRLPIRGHGSAEKNKELARFDGDA